MKSLFIAIATTLVAVSVVTLGQETNDSASTKSTSTQSTSTKSTKSGDTTSEAKTSESTATVSDKRSSFGGTTKSSKSGTYKNLAARFGVYDYVVFVLLLLVSAGIGIYFAFAGGKDKTTEELLLGNRSMGTLPVALSILASFMSAVTILGTATEMYVYGTQYLVACFSYLIVIPSAAYIYMPVFHQLELTSAYEYLERRFSKATRTLGTIYFAFQMMIYMAVVLYAPALAMSQVTGIGVWTSVLSIGLVCTFYTALGGIKAVIWTDVFQVGLMYGSMVAVVLKGSSDVGGMDAAIKVAAAHDRVTFFNFNLDPTDRHTIWGLLIGFNFTWLAIYGVSQTMVQRYMTLPTVRQARVAIWCNLPGLILLLIICALAGILIFAKYFTCDPLRSKQITKTDQLLPFYVMETFGNYPGFPGLFVSGIFSGALSTVSSGVNSLATVALEDIIKSYYKKEIPPKTASYLTRGLAIGFGLLAVALVLVAERLGNVLVAALAIFGIMGGPLLGVFTLGIFFPHANKYGAISGMVVSLAITLTIGIGNFIYSPVYAKAPISIAGCDAWMNATLDTTKPPYVNALFRVSYVWYSMIATFLVLIVGFPVSLATGWTSPKLVDPRLISPYYNEFINSVFRWSKYREPLLVRTAEEALSTDKDKESTKSEKDETLAKSATGVSNQGFELEESSAKAGTAPNKDAKPLSPNKDKARDESGSAVNTPSTTVSGSETAKGGLEAKNEGLEGGKLSAVGSPSKSKKVRRLLSPNKGKTLEQSAAARKPISTSAKKNSAIENVANKDL